MTVVLVSLAVAAALVREGTARALRPLLPYVGRASGVLLLATGGYLVYYWARLRFGDSVTLADDPAVGLVTRFSAHVQSAADGHSSTIVGAAAGVAGAALAAGAWRWSRR